MKVSAFKEKFFIKNGMCGVENGISLYMMHKAVFTILISNKYHQFRVWYNFVGMNFNREKHVGFTAKDIEVQCFGFISQEDLLKYSSLKISNRYAIVYMSYSCYYEFSPGIWQTCFKLYWLYLFKQDTVQSFSMTILLVYMWSTSLIDNFLLS